MEIGPYKIKALKPGMPIMTLAPMAGISNGVFRMICARLGARMVGVEFINCNAIAHKNQKTLQMMDFSDAAYYAENGQSILAAQIYGNNIDLMVKGARELQRRGAQIVDINFGCSVPKILKSGSGASYLQDLEQMTEIVSRVADALEVPVTIKTRLGWDQGSICVEEIVERVQEAGAQAIAIHARTVKQRLNGQADWSWITRARKVACIPLLGNGDVRCYEDALRMQQETGCDGVMIGRAAVANPWIFSGRNPVSLQERITLAKEQLQQMVERKGERVGVYETRKHLTHYLKGFTGAARIRQQIMTLDTLPEILSVLDQCLYAEEAERA